MEQSSKKLRRISAFAAYNGHIRQEPATNGSIPEVGKDKKKKKKEKRKHQSTPITTAWSIAGVDDDQSDEIDDASVLDEALGDDEEIPQLVLADDVPVKKAKGEKRKSAAPEIANGSVSNGEANSKRRKPQESNKHPDSVARKLFVSDDDSAAEKATDGISTLLDALTYTNSATDAKTAFAWLIDPISIGEFFETYWEKQPLRIRRENRNYYNGLFSSDILDSILKEHDIQYSVNLDITKYENGERKTLNPTGRAYAPTVWDFYKDGCSIRMLNPQTYSEPVWKLNSTLQEFFGTFVGANVYLTPANTQGFAPHYDDIEAFVVQLEGVKRWRVYKPKSEQETLPRFSSPNYKPNDVGKPIMEVELRPGDLLYFPRGYIHQAVASKEEHSLHITISTTQKNSWGDLLEILMTQALDAAMRESLEYRKALPLNYLDIAGTVNSDKRKKGRKDFLETAKRFLSNLASYADIDGAVDQMAKEKYIQDALPPCLTEDEKQRCINGREGSAVVFMKDTKIRLVRKHCLRVVMEVESEVTIYYNTENSRVYRGKPLQSFQVDNDLASGIDYLIETYPRYISVKDLPVDGDIDKIRICQMLYEKALLMLESP